MRRTSASSPALAAVPSTAAAAFALAVLAASTAALPRVAARTAVASLVPAEEELAVALPTLGASRFRFAAGIFESSMQPPIEKVAMIFKLFQFNFTCHSLQY